MHCCLIREASQRALVIGAKLQVGAKAKINDLMQRLGEEELKQELSLNPAFNHQVGRDAACVTCDMRAPPFVSFPHILAPKTERIPSPRLASKCLASRMASGLQAEAKRSVLVV